MPRLKSKGLKSEKIHMEKFIGNIYFTVSTEQRLLKSNLLDQTYLKRDTLPDSYI